MGGIEQRSSIVVCDAEGVFGSRILMTKGTWEKASHGIDQNECGEFATTEDIISDAQFQWREGLDDPFVDSFIMPSDQQQPCVACQRFNRVLRGSPSLWCEQHTLRTSWVHLFDGQHRIVEGLAHHHHARAATKGPIVDLVVLVVGPVPDVMNMGLKHPRLMGSSNDARVERCIEHGGKQGQDVDPHGGVPGETTRPSCPESDRCRSV